MYRPVHRICFRIFDRSKVLVFAAALLAGLAGCEKNGPPTSSSANPSSSPEKGPQTAHPPGGTSSTNTSVQGQPQPKLPTIKLWLGNQEVAAEIARTQSMYQLSSQVQTGMMFRTNMLENEGMLFVFPLPHQTGFWMKNTLLPLSCAYIDGEGNILEIHDMQPLNETPIISQTDQIRYVLEVKQGWFERNKIGPGIIIRTEKGTLEDTFFKRR